MRVELNRRAMLRGLAASIAIAPMASAIADPGPTIGVKIRLARLAFEFIGTVDSSTGMLLLSADTKKGLEYHKPVAWSMKVCDWMTGETREYFPLYETKDHAAIKRAFNHYG